MSKYSIQQVNDGINWLDLKHKDHGEYADKQCADMLRAYAATFGQPQPEPADAVSSEDVDAACFDAINRDVVTMTRHTRASYAEQMAFRNDIRAALESFAARHMRGVPAGLKDPETVLAMMLRGMIAIPTIRSMVHLRGEVPNGENVQLLRIAELQEQLEAARCARRVPSWWTTKDRALPITNADKEYKISLGYPASHSATHYSVPLFEYLPAQEAQPTRDADQ